MRRAFLARLCLAAGPDALWPFNKSTPVDVSLADDATRTRWRTHWRDQLAGLGMAAAADPRGWVKKHQMQQEPAPDAELTVSERSRLKELERRNRKLEMENSFLKKCAAYFAKDPR